MSKGARDWLQRLNDQRFASLSGSIQIFWIAFSGSQMIDSKGGSRWRRAKRFGDWWQMKSFP